MAATYKLSDSINWVQPFVNWANLAIGTNNEPAITSANQTLETIVGPPFVWPWNRNTATFMTIPGVQDYSVAISTFGFLESVTIQLAGSITSVTVANYVATVVCNNTFSSLPNGGVGQTVTLTGCTTNALNSTFVLVSITPTGFTFNIPSLQTLSTETETGAVATSGDTMGLELKWGSMHESRAQDRPTFVSTQSCDEAGTTFVFRLMPVPDQVYKVILTYQNSPTAITSLSGTWGIPDQLQYIYNYFFAFFVFDYFDDPRAARYRQLAVAALLSRQSGLSETDRNLFLGSWLDVMQEEQAKQTSTTQGAQARGL
jgi:hypothetical protein